MRWDMVVFLFFEGDWGMEVRAWKRIDLALRFGMNPWEYS